MANQLAPKLTADTAPAGDDDSSTTTLIARYRSERGR
jgi:glucose-6-phosphate isomerase